MTLPFLDGEALARLLPLPDAIDALEEVFTAPRRPDTPLRTHVDVPGGELLLMPSAGDGGTGVKLVTLNTANPGRGLPLIHAVYVLFDAETSAPLAVIDGAALTALRTSAVSALATRHLARPEASRLVLFGAGVQATAHLDAMRAVRPITSVRVVSRSPGPAERLVAWAGAQGVEASVAGPDAVADADVVCTCTTSSSPVFDGTRLAEGAHVNAVGAYRTDQRELDHAVMGRASVVAVETLEAALAEAGEVVGAIAAGIIGEDDLVELGRVASGTARRRKGGDVTVFKAVGVAFEDLAVAAAAVARR
ncbi:MAG TPA: ornithine cyclodeaminase family protein [Actinomycetota bacterium]|jgi:ornithine cyclodeaminase